MFVSPYNVLMTLLLLLETKKWDYNNQFTAEIQQVVIDWLDSVLHRIGNISTIYRQQFRKTAEYIVDNVLKLSGSYWISLQNPTKEVRWETPTPWGRETQTSTPETQAKPAQVSVSVCLWCSGYGWTQLQWGRHHWNYQRRYCLVMVIFFFKIHNLLYHNCAVI